MLLLVVLVTWTLQSNAQNNALIKQGGVLLNGSATGQVARWNGSNWLAAEPTVVSSAPLTGNGTTATPLTLAAGTSAGDVLTWTGSAWASSPLSVNVDPSLDGDGSSGTPLMIAGANIATPGQFLLASGSGGVLWDDLSIGNTLTGDGVTTNLNLAQQGASNGQVLKWNGTTWAPAADNSGAGTDETWGKGSYSSPTFSGKTITDAVFRRGKISLFTADTTGRAARTQPARLEARTHGINQRRFNQRAGNVASDDLRSSRPFGCSRSQLIHRLRR